MNDNLTARPTLETLREMMRDLRDTVNKRFDDVSHRLEALNGHVNELDIRVDRMDSFVHNTYTEMVAVRADFNESKVQLKEHLPSPK